jgi:signal peptidase I
MDPDFKPPSAGSPPRANRPGKVINDFSPGAGGAGSPPSPTPAPGPSPNSSPIHSPASPTPNSSVPSVAAHPAAGATSATTGPEQPLNTSIRFHVPGVHPGDGRPRPSKPAPITTFDRDAPPPVAPRSDHPTGKHHQALRDIISIGGVLISALLLAFCLITFVFQSYQVDGPSMQTTLQNADHLIVWKVPKSLANLTHRAYIPNRGDVIVFNEPNLSDYGQDNGKQLIKRVIGLPGERVVVKNGILTVYNKEHPEGFQPDKDLPYGKVIVTTPGNIDVTVGEKQIYVCGDNRTNSLDSRVFGPIDSSNIVGKLVLRVLPLNAFKKF